MSEDRFEPPEELGIRLFAALLSYQLGNALQTEYEKIKAGEYGKISPQYAMIAWQLLYAEFAPMPKEQ